MDDGGTDAKENKTFQLISYTLNVERCLSVNFIRTFVQS